MSTDLLPIIMSCNMSIITLVQINNTAIEWFNEVIFWNQSEQEVKSQH